MQDKTRSELVKEFEERIDFLWNEEIKLSKQITFYRNNNQTVPKDLEERHEEIVKECSALIDDVNVSDVLYKEKKQWKKDRINSIFIGLAQILLPLGKGKIDDEEFDKILSYVEPSKLMPLPDERKLAAKELKVKYDKLALELNEKVRNGTQLEGFEAMADCLLENFKLDSLSPIKKHSLMIIENLEIVLEQIENILEVSKSVSLGKKRYAIKEIRNKILRSDTKAKQLLETEKIGLIEGYSEVFVSIMKEQLPKQVYSNTDVLMFTPLITDPLFVAKTHIPMYGRILELLDREEEMILIELRNGKSLDYSPLNDKKDNGNPTTSAPVEEGVNLTYREIATLYYFNGFELTYDNADRIAFYHGQTSRTRGQQLIEKYYTPILKEVESLSNNKYNREIYTNKKSFEAISKIIPLLETEELKLIANEYLKKSETYRK